jgi:hypothetical protein
MKTLSCAAVRRRLSALCDGELTLTMQIAIEAHLKRCDACTAEGGVIREVGDTLRTVAAAAINGCADELSALQAAVIPRITAERDASLAQRIEDLFEDMHLVWATGSGVIAGVVCGLLAFGMVHVARAQPESLAALVEMLSHEPVPLPEPLVLPRVYADAVMPATVMNQQAGEEAVSALAAVVMRDGSLSDIELLQPDGRTRAVTGRQARLDFDLLDAVSTARFEPARVAGSPVALNVVWVLTHTTVRGRAPLGVGSPTLRAKVRSSRASGVAAG